VPSDRNAEARRVAVERHIEEERRRIALFRGLVAQAASRGGDTTVGERILANMESTLSTLEETRRANGALRHEGKLQSLARGVDNVRSHRLVDESRDAVDAIRQAPNGSDRQA